MVLDEIIHNRRAELKMFEDLNGDNSEGRLTPATLTMTMWRNLISAAYSHPTLILQKDLEPLRQLFWEYGAIHEASSTDIVLPLVPPEQPNHCLRPQITYPHAPLQMVFGEIRECQVDESGIRVTDCSLTGPMKKALEEMVEFIRTYPQGLYEEAYGFIYDFLIRFGVLPRTISRVILNIDNIDLDIVPEEHNLTGSNDEDFLSSSTEPDQYDENVAESEPEPRSAKKRSRSARSSGSESESDSESESKSDTSSSDSEDSDFYLPSAEKTGGVTRVPRDYRPWALRRKDRTKQDPAKPPTVSYKLKRSAAASAKARKPKPIKVPKSLPPFVKTNTNTTPPSFKNTFTCPLCPITQSRRDLLENHFSQAHPGEVMGEVEPVQVRVHVQGDPRNPPCPICQTQFQRRDGLRNHLRRKHRDEDLSPYDDLLRPRELNVPIEDRLQCPGKDCVQLFCRADGLRAHFGRRHQGEPPPASWKDCKRKDPKPKIESVDEHAELEPQTKAAVDVGQSSRVPCPICPRTFSTHNFLLFHWRHAHTDVDLNAYVIPSSLSQGQGPRSACPICHRNFSASKFMWYHCRTAHADCDLQAYGIPPKQRRTEKNRGVSCKGWTQQHKRGRTQHYEGGLGRGYHWAEKRKAKLEEADAEEREAKKRRHERREAEKRVAQRREADRRNAADMREADRREATESREASNRLEAANRREAEKQEAAKKLQESQTPNSGLSCPVCQRSFKGARYMHIHFRSTHTDVNLGAYGIQPEPDKYACPICNRSFGGKRYMHYHCRQTHTEVDLSAYGIPPKRGTVPNPDGIYNCGVCHHSVVLLRSLKIHYGKRHPEVEMPEYPPDPKTRRRRVEPLMPNLELQRQAPADSVEAPESGEVFESVKGSESEGDFEPESEPEETSEMEPAPENEIVPNALKTQKVFILSYEIPEPLKGRKVSQTEESEEIEIETQLKTNETVDTVFASIVEKMVDTSNTFPGELDEIFETDELFKIDELLYAETGYESPGQSTSRSPAPESEVKCLEFMQTGDSNEVTPVGPLTSDQLMDEFSPSRNPLQVQSDHSSGESSNGITEYLCSELASTFGLKPVKLQLSDCLKGEKGDELRARLEAASRARASAPPPRPKGPKMKFTGPLSKQMKERIAELNPVQVQIQTKVPKSPKPREPSPSDSSSSSEDEPEEVVKASSDEDYVPTHKEPKAKTLKKVKKPVLSEPTCDTDDTDSDFQPKYKEPGKRGRKRARTLDSSSGSSGEEGKKLKVQLERPPRSRSSSVSVRSGGSRRKLLQMEEDN